MPPASEYLGETETRDQVHRKILLVDDNLDLLELAIDYLHFLGHEVIAASNAEEALDRLRATPDVQVLISDVTMPGMSGIELARRAREMYPWLRVLLVSGRADLVAAEAATQHFDFLPKPYRIADMNAFLARR
ncbi:Response regulator receiver domain-containing protein [Noviherbaspirillum humi]|uniref:Response regulator receiver domain-containing protein n=1 Tax=Noviherbaspirillum humi TaxID=1688639 RepID=A0A239LN80_9BURK|nr:response regulator [Noviherbaspirillum humi]SNT31362.1 Response regulator receiver domain-containing protein [Noviherbaspirillum humi]